MTICTKKNNLLWNPHVNEMISKAYAKLGLMRKCKRQFTNELFVFYKTSFRIRRCNIYLELYSRIFQPENRENTTRSCKVRDGGNKLASKNLYIETGWIPLRREYHRFQFFNIYHKKKHPITYTNSCKPYYPKPYYPKSIIIILETVLLEKSTQ